MPYAWSMEERLDVHSRTYTDDPPLVMSLLGSHHVFELLEPCPIVAKFCNRENGFEFYDRLENYMPWRPAFQTLDRKKF